MGQLIQLVFLASMVTSCISHSFPSTKTKSSYGQSKSEFPIKFMNKLIASLSPDKLAALFIPINLADTFLEDKYGNTEKTPCLSRKDIQNYNIVRGTDHQQYYVITNKTEKYQPVVHNVCDRDGPNGNKCEPNNPHKVYGYCCRQHKKTTALYVIPVPKSLLYVRNGYLFHKDTNKKYENFTMIKKDVLMNSQCSCDLSKTSIKENYSCPNPESTIWP